MIGYAKRGEHDCTGKRGHTDVGVEEEQWMLLLRTLINAELKERAEAGLEATMKRALQEFHIAPIKTTIPLHLRIMDDQHFQTGDVDTGFVERVLLGR